MEQPWNSGWWFRPGPVEDAFLSREWPGPGAEFDAVASPAWVQVHLPHDMIGAPLNAFDERTFARKGCYAKAIEREDLESFWAPRLVRHTQRMLQPSRPTPMRPCRRLRSLPFLSVSMA